jgi:hypothetical protein
MKYFNCSTGEAAIIAFPPRQPLRITRVKNEVTGKIAEGPS